MLCWSKDSSAPSPELGQRGAHAREAVVVQPAEIDRAPRNRPACGPAPGSAGSSCGADRCRRADQLRFGLLLAGHALESCRGRVLRARSLRRAVKLRAQNSRPGTLMSDPPKRQRTDSRIARMARPLPARPLVTLGAVVIAGWLLREPALVQVIPGATATVFNTALSFVLAGLALIALDSPRPKLRHRARCGGACDRGRHAGAEPPRRRFRHRLAFAARVARRRQSHPGRASLPTSLGFALFGAAVDPRGCAAGPARPGCRARWAGCWSRLPGPTLPLTCSSSTTCSARCGFRAWVC